MVAARLLTARAFAHRIVSLREQRRPAGGIRGGEPGGEIDADAENAAKTDERRVHGDVNERGAVVERERERERDARERLGSMVGKIFSLFLSFSLYFLSLILSYSVRKKVLLLPTTNEIYLFSLSGFVFFTLSSALFIFP